MVLRTGSTLSGDVLSDQAIRVCVRLAQLCDDAEKTSIGQTSERIGDLTLDRDTRIVARAGKEISLSSKEFMGVTNV